MQYGWYRGSPSLGFTYSLDDRAEKLERLFRDLVGQVEGADYRDKLGHPLENNAAWLALKAETE